jgi:hypothetical protein
MAKQIVGESRKKEDGLLNPVAAYIHADHMRRFGISNTMRLARTVNRLRFLREDAYRREQYANHFDELLAENGQPRRAVAEIRDGWALDTSQTLPHLDQVLTDSEEIIAERAGVRATPSGTYRSYFQDVWEVPDADRYPSFLNFVSSSDVLGTICNYMKTIPVLSTTIPEGIRFVESNAAYDDQPDNPHDSQLFHVDYYSLPTVYVLVLLRDTTIEHGPWSFLPASTTKRVAGRLNYWRRGRPYRLSDEEIYSVVDRSELVEFCYPRGTVLFIESSACFHFGSRNSVKPRFQLMCGFSALCRTDFTEFFMKSRGYQPRAGDSRLRKMLLDKRFLG